MKIFQNQHAWKAFAILAAAALYWVSTTVPEAHAEARAGLLGLAGLLVGWLGMRRPID